MVERSEEVESSRASGSGLERPSDASLRTRMWSVGQGLVGFFMPRPAPSGERERLRAELVIAFDLIFLLINAFVAVLLLTVVDLPPSHMRVAFLVMPGLCAGLCASLILVRYAHALRAAAHATVGTVFVTLALSTLFQGGLESSVTALWVLVPTVGGLLAGRQACGVWSALVVAFAFGVFFVQQGGWVTFDPMETAAYRATVLINLTIACVAATAAVGSYETINANLRRTVALERAKFRYQAGHDALTQLPNRRLFMELQETALRRADRTKQKVGLFIIDLDDFKNVNDRYGHPAGDRMLEAVGARLRKFLRVTDAVARLGGDEFAVLVELLDDHEAARLFAERLQSELSGPVSITRDEEAELKASVGIALYPDDGENVDELHEAADGAMYAAKRDGGGHHRFAEHEDENDDPFFRGA